MGIRVYLLAREIGISNRELMDYLAKQGIPITNHLAALKDPEAEMVRRAFGGDGGGAVQKPATRARARRAGVGSDLREALRARMEAAQRRLGLPATDGAPEPAEAEGAAAPAAAAVAERPPAAESVPSAAPAEVAPEKAPSAVPEAPAAEAAPEAERPAVEVVEPPAPPEATAAPAGERPAPEAPATAPSGEAAPAAASAAPEAPAPEAPEARRPKKPSSRRRVVTAKSLRAGPKPFITKPARPGAPAAPRPASAYTPMGGPEAVPFVKPGAPRRRQGAGGGKGGKARKRGTVRFFPSYESGMRDGWSSSTFPRGRPFPGAHRAGRKRGRDGRAHGGAPQAPPQRPGRVEVSLPITVKEFSAVTGIRVSQILRKLLLNKIIDVTANSHLDGDVLELVGAEFDVEVSVSERRDLEAPIKEIESREDPPEDLIPRAPVVTFLGHVDHGKTSLLDKIRESNVQEKEAGGITQHMSAYKIEKGDLEIVFLDTPGHKAFTQMRARGANVTDIVVLVVAADDGPMPQTEEALNHARAARVPVIVAINKIDKSNANVTRCRERLARMGLASREWGGSTEIVDVSALTGQGIDDLLEIIHLEAHGEFKSNPKRPALGVVLDSESSGRRGIVATVLVRNGTLRIGDPILCGCAHGPVRNMRSTTTGEPLEAAGPSTPVEITGLSIVPEAGDHFYVLGDLSAAREIAEQRLVRRREEERAEREQISRETLLERVARGTVEELRIVLKGDVKGTLEAVRAQLANMSGDEVKVVILHAGVGGISEGDVLLADASDALVLGFGVAPDERARAAAEERSVEIRTYDVIYELLEEMRRLLEDRLAPEIAEEVTGHAEIRQVFRASRIGNIAGCFIRDGVIARGDRIRVIRDGIVIHTGRIGSLRRHKDDVREVKEGFECGVKIQDYDDIKEGDVLETFRVVQRRRTLKVET